MLRGPEFIQVANAADPSAKESAACLACHGGSFDKLSSKKPAFKAPTGEIINPHVYIPHKERKAENVPNCTDCHSKHSLPPAGKIDLSQVKVDSCFRACHHDNNFKPCQDCHASH
jgi:hypothetical protein